MVFAASVVRVLIASPRDTLEMRNAVEVALHEWNGDRAAGAVVVLLPRRWEANAVPELTGTDAQSVINAQLVDDADIVIGIFHTTLGSETPRAVSGTAEELIRSHEAGKPVHVYFSVMPIPRDHNRAALAALDAFKAQLGEQGLYGSFTSPIDLKEQVKQAIELDLASLSLSTPAVRRSPSGASLRATFAYERERDADGRMLNRRERIEVVNDGQVAAEDVTYEILLSDSTGVDRTPRIRHDRRPFTIAPNGGAFTIPIQRLPGTAASVQFVLKWTESGAERTSEQTVALN